MNNTYKTNKTDWRRLGRSILLVALLLGASLPAMAADYVITYTTGGTTYYLGMDNNNQLVAKTTPDATCVWQGYYNGDYSLSTTTRINIRNKNNTDYYLYYDGSSIVASTTNQRRWYGGDGSSIYYYNNNTYRYIHNSGSTITTSNSATNAFIPYTVTVTSVASISTNPTINGADVLTATGNSTYTASGAAYRIGYTNYNFNSANHYFDANGNSFTGTPANATIGTAAWSLTDNAYATVNSSGVVNVSSLPESDITLTLTVTYPVTGGTPAAPAGTTLTGTKEIIIQGTKPSAPIISVSGTSVTMSTTAAGTTTIRYTLDGTDPTASTGTVYSGAIDLSGSTTSPVTIKAITVRNGNASAVSEEIVTLTLPTPVITVNGSAGTATIACDITGTTIYYTTNGSTPTTSSSQYSGTLSGLSPMTTIKAIAVKDGWNNSPVASATVTIPSGVSGGVVTLFDYEDHNWTYYAGVPTTVDGGNYNTNYLGKLYSPNPRNVKITYKANGGAVSISESETEFVYYKTLEEGTTSGQYPYQVISNPFSKRPNGKGFGGWKIKEGADYISGYNDEAILPLDAEIVFTNLPYTSVNCTSAEIELEATWVNANIYNLSSWSASSNNNYTYNTTNSNGSSSGTYETNILVINRNYSGTITSSIPVTIMMVAPDGSTDYRGSYTFTGSITPGANIITKIENAHWQPGAAINAGGRNLTIGRGMTMDGTRRAFYCLNNSRTVNQVVKIESGNFSTFTHFNTDPNSITKQWIYFGNDYDRAKKDNTKLSFTGKFLIGDGRTLGVSSGNEICRVYSISGRFLTGITVSNANADESYYFSVSNTYNSGHRYLEIIGGEWMGSIAGGIDNNTNTDRALTLRMRGGSIEGSIYGAAQYSQGAGTRTFVFTGGTVKGWVAGGANGTASTDGELDGATYLYVGGHANMNSNSSTKVINRAIGGNVFGAGCGFNASSSSGQVSLGTNVVVADEAYIERGVYGGGSYGYCATNSTSNVYITGGNIACKAGGVNGTSYLAAIDGGVYGGASQNKGGSANLYVSGGTVDGSAYGGSNYTGVLSGGTNVQLHGGTINGSIYGGGNGKGGATDITTAVAVKVYGGSVTGAVYGCNNVSGAPQSTVTVDVYGTDPAPSAGSYAINQVFGGGNQADYGGTPVVTVHCTDADKDISVGEIYGGGNQANVTATSVTIEAGNIIGDVYGGGRQADVGSGGTSVTINGGTIRRVFGGNNISGEIASGTAGKITVLVNKTTDCPLKVGELYGGGNLAGSQAGSITIQCTGDLTNDHNAVAADGGATPPSAIGHTLEGIGDVYGGANNALVTGDITLDINSGMIYRVFGGNNTGNTVSGDITVNVAQGAATCGWYVGYVYGGGNNAPYGTAGTNYPAVNHSAGKVTYNVYGGGKGSTATVTSNPKVILSGTAQVGGNVFGGGNAAPVVGNPTVLLKD